MHVANTVARPGGDFNVSGFFTRFPAFNNSLKFRLSFPNSQIGILVFLNVLYNFQQLLFLA